jgi:nitrite reductase (NADH) large subunit
MRDARAAFTNVVKGDRLIGAVLYGDTTDGSWYFDLLKRQSRIFSVDFRQHLHREGNR